MIKLKVLHGTIPDQHICPGCAHSSHRVEGGRDIYNCSVFGRIRKRVTECQAHMTNEDDILRQFRQQAYDLYFDDNHEPQFISPYERELAEMGGHRRVRTSSRPNPRRKAAGNPSIQ